AGPVETMLVPGLVGGTRGDRMHARARNLVIVVAAVVSLWAAAGASAYQTNGVAVSDFATGFQTVDTSGGRLGPIGIAIDHGGRVFVTDQADGWLYRFDGAGTASPPHRLGPAPLGGRPAGLAFDADDYLYVVRFQPKDVLQVDAH